MASLEVQKQNIDSKIRSDASAAKTSINKSAAGTKRGPQAFKVSATPTGQVGVNTSVREQKEVEAWRSKSLADINRQEESALKDVASQYQAAKNSPSEYDTTGLSDEEKIILKDYGVDEINRRRSLQNDLQYASALKASEDEMKKDYVKVAGNQWISRTDYDALSASDKELVQKIGINQLSNIFANRVTEENQRIEEQYQQDLENNRLQVAKFTGSNFEIATDKWLPNSERSLWDSLSASQKKEVIDTGSYTTEQVSSTPAFTSIGFGNQAPSARSQFNSDKLAGTIPSNATFVEELPDGGYSYSTPGKTITITDDGSFVTGRTSPGVTIVGSDLITEPIYQVPTPNGVVEVPEHEWTGQSAFTQLSTILGRAPTASQLEQYARYQAGGEAPKDLMPSWWYSDAPDPSWMGLPVISQIAWLGRAVGSGIENLVLGAQLLIPGTQSEYEAWWQGTREPVEKALSEYTQMSYPAGTLAPGGSTKDSAPGNWVERTILLGGELGGFPAIRGFSQNVAPKDISTGEWVQTGISTIFARSLIRGGFKTLNKSFPRLSAVTDFTKVASTRYPGTIIVSPSTLSSAFKSISKAPLTLGKMVDTSFVKWASERFPGSIILSPSTLVKVTKSIVTSPLYLGEKILTAPKWVPEAAYNRFWGNPGLASRNLMKSETLGNTEIGAALKSRFGTSTKIAYGNVASAQKSLVTGYRNLYRFQELKTSAMGLPNKFLGPIETGFTRVSSLVERLKPGKTTVSDILGTRAPSGLGKVPGKINTFSDKLSGKIGSIFDTKIASTESLIERLNTKLNSAVSKYTRSVTTPQTFDQYSFYRSGTGRFDPYQLSRQRVTKNLFGGSEPSAVDSFKSGFSRPTLGDFVENKPVAPSRLGTEAINATRSSFKEELKKIVGTEGEIKNYEVRIADLESRLNQLKINSPKELDRISGLASELQGLKSELSILKKGDVTKLYSELLDIRSKIPTAKGKELDTLLSREAVLEQDVQLGLRNMYPDWEPGRFGSGTGRSKPLTYEPNTSSPAVGTIVRTATGTKNITNPVFRPSNIPAGKGATPRAFLTPGIAGLVVPGTLANYQESITPVASLPSGIGTVSRLGEVTPSIIEGPGTGQSVITSPGISTIPSVVTTPKIKTNNLVKTVPNIVTTPIHLPGQTVNTIPGIDIRSLVKTSPVTYISTNPIENVSTNPITGTDIKIQSITLPAMVTKPITVTEPFTTTKDLTEPFTKTETKSLVKTETRTGTKTKVKVLTLPFFPTTSDKDLEEKKKKKKKKKKYATYPGTYPGLDLFMPTPLAPIEDVMKPRNIIKKTRSTVRRSGTYPIAGFKEVKA